jgi:hypothetical protein
MTSQANRPTGDDSALNLERLIERARILGDQGRQTMAELRSLRARLEVSHGDAQRSLRWANAALRRADERLRAAQAGAVEGGHQSAT